MRRRRLALAVIWGVIVLAPVALFGYGRMTEDICFTEPERRLPEGSSGSSRTVAWPPGAVRCDWVAPDGSKVGWTTLPGPLWMLYVGVGSGLLVTAVRVLRSR